MKKAMDRGAFAIAAVALAACSHVAQASSEEVDSAATPIGKVIELLNQMVAKGTKEMQDEQVRFASFEQWCDDQTRVKTDEINDSNDKIEMLSAKIEKATTLIKQLTERIQELDHDVSRWDQDMKAATAVRDKERADFKATNADYGESLDALDGALTTLKERADNLPQAEFTQVLLQIRNSKGVPTAAKHALTSFIQLSQPNVEEMPDKQLSKEAPEAYGYESQTGGVIGMLESLKSEFEKKKYDLEKEDMKAEHAFNLIMQELTDSTENANHEIAKKTKDRAATEGEKAELEGDKATTEKDRGEDQAYLAETEGLCAQKKSDFASRQKLREEELAAVGKAIEIMGSDTVAGAGKEHLPKLAQVSGTSLAQLRSGATAAEAAVLSQAASYLADRARTSNSRVLSLLSQQVAANPFVKVKKMIKDMVSRLMQEATEETEHKGWCDTELGTNKQVRDAKSEDVEELTALKEDLTAEIADLTQDINDLTAKVKELDQAMADALQNRMEDKAKNEKAIADAQVAQVAVQQATAVLKDFYKKSSQATAFGQTAQTPAEDAPETFDKPYTGMLPEGGSVVDFMEVILSDFVRLESQATSEETTEQDEFDTFTFDSNKDKALKSTEMKQKTEKREDRKNQLVKTGEELKLTQSQLDKANAYYLKLKPTCVDSGITYEERVQKREEEIQSLQETLKILVNTDLS